MSLRNLLIKDTTRKECQVYFHLSEETDKILTHNVAAIVDSGKKQIQLQTIEEMFIPESMLNDGWKRNDGLYDTEILEYNRNNPKSPLKRWG